MSRVIVNLKPVEKEALIELAERERRDPREQAALIIRNELQSRGLLAEPDPINLVLKTLGALDADGSCVNGRA